MVLVEEQVKGFLIEASFSELLRCKVFKSIMVHLASIAVPHLGLLYSNTKPRSRPLQN